MLQSFCCSSGSISAQISLLRVNTDRKMPEVFQFRRTIVSTEAECQLIKVHLE
jgi:hypothetical protein